MSSTLSLGDFVRDGQWDCGHAWDLNSHREAWRDLGYPTGTDAAAAIVARAWGHESEVGIQDWIDQHDADEFGTLNPTDCYRAWRDGWQGRAIAYVAGYLPQWIDDRADVASADAWQDYLASG